MPNMPKEKVDYLSIFYTGNVTKSFSQDNNKMVRVCNHKGRKMYPRGLLVY